MMADTARLFGALFEFVGRVLWEAGVALVNWRRSRRKRPVKGWRPPWPPPVV